VKRLLVCLGLVVMVILGQGCAEMQKQFVDPFTQDSRKAKEPEFEWDSAFSSPGTSLLLEEKERMPTGDGTMLQYRVVATGFDAGEPVELWWKRGTGFQQLPGAVSDDGTVLIGGMDVLGVAGLAMGQAVDIAIASGEKRAQAKVIPFPIEAKRGPLWASAEVMTETGLLFLITMGGFEPAEKVEVTSEYKSESHSDVMEVSESGEIAFPVMFGKGDKGTAVVVGTGTVGSIVLEYLVGKDALAAQ